MTDTHVHFDEPLRFHRLTYLVEGDDVTVGRSDIDSYGIFPADGAELVRRLEAGHTPNAAAAWYEQQYHETVDMAELIEVLGDLELLVADGEAAITATAVRWQRLGRAMFSPTAWLAYGLIVAAAITAMTQEHRLVPRYQHLFFTRSSLTVLTLGIVLGQVPWMLLHEAFHALAGRRLGLHSKLSIGRRFYYIVLVTSLDGLVAVPRRQRYLPMLAGMVLDVLAASGLTLGAAALPASGGAGALIGKLLLSMAFGVVMRLAWQFYFFLRTDLFFLVTTVLGCNDLQGASQVYLINRIKTWFGRPNEPTDPWTSRDLAVARWYSWLMVAGYGLLGFVIVTVLAPTAWRILDLALHKLRHQESIFGVADLVVFLILNFGEVALAAFLAARSYHRKRAPSGRPSNTTATAESSPGALNQTAA